MTRFLGGFVVLLLLFIRGSHQGCLKTSIDPRRVLQLEQTVKSLGRQLMMQQFYAEERLRSEGNSGIKQTRVSMVGTKNYFSGTHTGSRLIAIHDHSNNIRTVGMGEFTAVLNGHEFRTRHNDYRLYMKSTTSTNYGAWEEIPFPDVPPAVLEKTTVDEQSAEMREWFKAWKNQDHSQRDYRKYFKPVLCYLEGAWTNTGKEIDEPFHSDRHFIDANSWFDLQEKIRVTSYMGSKSRLENLAFLPTTIMGFKNETIPEFAQWNYKILCHPLQRDLPLNRLRVVEDFSSRMMQKKTTYSHTKSRAARYQVNPLDKDSWRDVPVRYTLLDTLMEEIPGADNYLVHLNDTGLDGEDVLGMDNKIKDVSRYHRYYKTAQKDAMGVNLVRRGFSDAYMFAAKTTQNRVAGMVRKYKCTGRNENRVCQERVEKWTYAIPLEIIYMTPLYKWNPYNLEHKGWSRSEEGRTVTAGGRNGQCKDGKEYNGTNSVTYFQTPAGFFSGEEENTDPADTGKSGVCVLDRNNVRRNTLPSGTRVHLPAIKDVGVLRTRYPILPVHGEGSSVWKEVNALRDYAMDPKNLANMKWDSEFYTSTGIELEMQPSTQHTTAHTHTFLLSKEDVNKLKGSDFGMVFTTSQANSHTHDLEVRWNPQEEHFYYVKCGGKWGLCWDGHPQPLNIKE